MKIFRHINFRIIFFILVGIFGTLTQVMSQCPVTITASPGTTVCPGTSVTLTPSGATSYTWANDTTHTASIVVTPVSTTTYTVTGIGSCTDVVSITISVSEPPSVTIEVSSNTATATATGGSSPYTYLWSDGTTGDIHNGLTPGLYSVTVTDANGCSGSATTYFGCSVSITASATTVCPGTNVTLTASGSTSYSWFNDSSGTNTSSVVVNPTSTTTYQVMGTTGTCISYTSITINVSSPLVTISVSGTDATANISGGTSPYTYLWSTNETTSSITGLTNGVTYSVTVTDYEGCTSTASIYFSTACSAEFAIISDTTTQTIWVINNSTGTTPINYLWDWGDGTTSTGATPTYTYTSSGPHNICLTITDGVSCSSTFCHLSNLVQKKPSDGFLSVIAGQTVRVIFPPVISIECPTDIIANPTSLSGSVVNYKTPAGNDNCDCSVTIQNIGLPSGSTFPIGTTTNEFTVTDPLRNSISCKFTVTIRDPYCGKNKVNVCHKGKTICVSEDALQSHLNHGDELGECGYNSNAAMGNLMPTDTELSQNYPNPFNQTTQINYTISDDAFVILVVEDIMGQKVAELVNSFKNAGYYDVIFDAQNLPNGIYFYRLNTGQKTFYRKMSVLK